jgi:hypothetical protein
MNNQISATFDTVAQTVKTFCQRVSWINQQYQESSFPELFQTAGEVILHSAVSIAILLLVIVYQVFTRVLVPVVRHFWHYRHEYRLTAWFYFAVTRQAVQRYLDKSVQKVYSPEK